jgi:hypothetical protein
VSVTSYSRLGSTPYVATNRKIVIMKLIELKFDGKLSKETKARLDKMIIKRAEKAKEMRRKFLNGDYNIIFGRMNE